MRPASQGAIAALAIGVLVLIWGSTWAVIRIGLDGMPPLTGISLRFALASLILLVLAWRRGLELGRTRRERRLWHVNAILMFTISYGVVYWAEQWVPSGLAAVLYATFPLCVAFLAHVWLPGERLTGTGLVGILVGLVGVGVVFSDDLAALGGPMVAKAALVMLASPVASAVANVAVKRWGSGIDPISLTAVPMGYCALLTGLLAWWLEADRAIVWSVETVGAIVYLAVAGSAVTFTLYFWLLARVAATRLSLITYGVPVVAVAIGVGLMGERLTAGILAGTPLILAGVALAIRGTRSAARPKPLESA